MTGSGETSRLGQLGRARAWAVVLGAVVLCGASTAGVAVARTTAGTGGRPVVGAAGQMRPDGSPQQCFVTFPDCTSADPAVTFTMRSRGDSTGCTFAQDTGWGDGSPDTVKTYNGGVDGAPLVTFTHTYAMPRTFQITLTIKVTRNPNNSCAGGTIAIQFTLSAPPPLICQSSQVTVPATTVQVPIPAKGVSLSYGPQPLTFTPGPTSNGAQCTLRSGPGVTPDDLIIPGQATPIPLGQTEATATIDVLPANAIAATVPLCDFSQLQAMTNPSITPPLADFARTSNCLLTPTFHASWDSVARWTVPGIVQTADNPLNNSDTELYSTQPLTYYVDLDTLPLPQDFSGDTMSALVAFIYSTLAQNVPVLDRIAFIQDPPAHLLITNPQGRVVGLDSKNKSHGFAGAGYAEVGGRSIAWILEPVFGEYQVSVRAPSGSAFSVDIADLQFLGHATAPLIENFSWQGKLGSGGTASRRFAVRGTALAPALIPRESKTRVRRLTRVRFTLATSVVPLGAARVVWLFGDGARGNGWTTAHRYRRAGRFTPTVTVTDAVGYTVTVKLPVIVVSR